MELTLDAIVLPVSDIDRARDYHLGLGFRLDVDFVGRAGYRVVHMTPPAPQFPVVIGAGASSTDPGSVRDLHLIGFDRAEMRDEIEAARR